MGRGGVRRNPSGTQVIRRPPHPCWGVPRPARRQWPPPCALPEPCAPGGETAAWALAVASDPSAPTQGGAWGAAYEEPAAGPGDRPAARGLRGVGENGLLSLRGLSLISLICAKAAAAPPATVPELQRDGTYRHRGPAQKKLWRPLSGSVGPLGTGGDGLPEHLFIPAQLHLSPKLMEGGR